MTKVESKDNVDQVAKSIIGGVTINTTISVRFLQVILITLSAKKFNKILIQVQNGCGDNSW